MLKFNRYAYFLIFLVVIASMPLCMVNAAGGDLIWFKTIYPNNRDAGAEGVTVDTSGVYIVGYDNNGQWRIEKRHFNGSSIWNQTVNPSFQYESARDVAVDDTGLYVVGYDRVLGVSDNRWRIEKRHLENGTAIWAKTSNPSSGIDIANAVVVHSSGLYIAGFDDAPGNWQWRIEKRDPANGNSIWNKTRNFGVSDNEAYGIAVDGSGIYVVGKCVPLGETIAYWRVEKMGFDGSSVWNQTHDCFGHTSGATDVALDGTGIYVVGYAYMTYYNPSDMVWVIEKRDLDTGAVIWNQTSNYKVGDSTDRANGVTVDTSGVYIVGHKNDQEWEIEKRTLVNGSLIWQKESNPSTTYDWALDVAVESTGVYVVGDDGSPGSFEFKGRIEKRVLGMLEDNASSATGTGNVTVTVDKGVLGNLTAVDEANLPEAGKPDLVFPHGFFSFNITGIAPGETVTVNITFPSNIPAGSEYWKYHIPEGWLNVTSLVGSNDGDNMLTLTLTDGGLGDDDGEANGIIIDQGAPGSIGARATPVGGYIIKMDRLSLIAPYLASIIFMAFITLVIIKKLDH